MTKHSPKPAVLIVDDEKDNLQALNAILSADYAVVCARSGEEALRIATEDKPDLILLDVMMPGINGFETLVRLKESTETMHIPVIFIIDPDSGYDEEKGFVLGAVDFVKKPFKNIVVKARVNTQMEIVRQTRLNARLGTTDPLTGLPNRRNFDEHLNREWRRAMREKRPVTLLMMDIDKFKKYNDTYGHPQGDALLKAAARIFASAARRPADLAARLDGEEFAVLLPDTGLSNALLVAENIRAAMEAARIPTADGGGLTQATISIGAASLIPTPGSEVRDLIARAEAGLHTAKGTGRNRVHAEETSS